MGACFSPRSSPQSSSAPSSPATYLATGALVGNIPEAVREGRGGPASDRALAGLVVLIGLLAGQQLVNAARQFVSYRAIKRIDGWLLAPVFDALHRPVGIAHLQDPKLLTTWLWVVPIPPR